MGGWSRAPRRSKRSCSSSRSRRQVVPGGSRRLTAAYARDERAALSPHVNHVAEPAADVAEIYDALVMGTRDYLRKNGFRSAILGLSGGMDSSLVAAIAVDAVGSRAVHGFAMPSRYSSDHSVRDAYELARRLDIEIDTIAIEDRRTPP